MTTTKKITAYGTEISVLLQGNENDYICLTDMARYFPRSEWRMWKYYAITDCKITHSPFLDSL